MTAALFPTGLAMSFGSGEPVRVFRDLRSTAQSPKLYAVSTWPGSKLRGTECRFLVTAADLATIRTCWETCKGGGVAIDFRWPWAEQHYRLWVCTYANASLPYDLPVYAGSGHVFRNLTTGSVISGATVTTGGSNGRDKLTAWVSPPADGTELGLDVLGQLQLLVRLGGSWKPVEVGSDLFQLALTVDEV